MRRSRTTPSPMKHQNDKLKTIQLLDWLYTILLSIKNCWCMKLFLWFFIKITESNFIKSTKIAWKLICKMILSYFITIRLQHLLCLILNLIDPHTFIYLLKIATWKKIQQIYRSTMIGKFERIATTIPKTRKSTKDWLTNPAQWIFNSKYKGFCENIPSISGLRSLDVNV